MQFSADEMVEAREDVVSCELESGSALLDLTSSKYFRLNDTAAFLWEKLEAAPASASQLADHLVEKYAVEHAQCLADVTKILGALEKAELIVRQRP